MNSYTITITADDDGATITTLRLDMSGGEVRLTDLHLHAGNGLSTGQLPPIDYGLLLRAIASATPTPITPAPAAPAGEVHAAPTTLPEPEPVAAGRDKARQPASAATKRPRAAAPPAARPARTRRQAASKTTPALAELATSTRTRRAAANKTAAAPNKTARAAKKAAEATPAKKSKKTTRAAAGGRVYRRMPDDFATVYRQAGSAAAIADHYDVPRHTAHGWIRRLRGQGIIPTGR